MIDVAWFKSRMKEVGVTQEDLGHLLKRDRTKVSRLFKDQKMTVADAHVFAKALDVPVGEILFRAGIDDAGPVPLLDTFAPVDVIGTVQAGVWCDAFRLPGPDRRRILIPRIPGVRKLFALEVRGESMNQLFREGDVLVCQPIHDFSAPVVSGLLVIVERRMHDQVETTVKELEIRGGEYWLWPRSDNPQFQQPLQVPPPEAWDGDDSKEVRILAVVLRSIQNRLPGG